MGPWVYKWSENNPGRRPGCRKGWGAQKWGVGGFTVVAAGVMMPLVKN